MVGIRADMSYSPSGPFGSIVAHREESRVPSIQESHTRGSRSRSIAGGRGPSRSGCGRQFSPSIAGVLTTGRISTVISITSRLWLSSIWPMASATRVRIDLGKASYAIKLIFCRPPKRDWRDWFIMATVMGGVGYGMYFVAKVRPKRLITGPQKLTIESALYFPVDCSSNTSSTGTRQGTH